MWESTYRYEKGVLYTHCDGLLKVMYLKKLYVLLFFTKPTKLSGISVRTKGNFT